MVIGRKTVTKTAAATAAKRTPQKKSVEAKPESASTPSGDLDLGDILVISNVLEWHEKVAAIFEGEEMITLEGGKIEQIDGTGLQFLVAIVKEATARGLGVTWKDASEILHDSAARLGLSRILRLDRTTDAG